MKTISHLTSFFLLFTWIWVQPIAAQDPPLTVQGRVIDEGGEAVTGADVSLLPFDDIHARYGFTLDQEPEPLGSTRTDAAGRFRVQAPSPGPYLLRVSARGHAEVALRLTPLLWPKTLPPIELPATRAFTVTVVDPEGAPIEGVRVAVDDLTRRSSWRMRHKRAATWMRQQRARTDARGRARLSLAGHPSPRIRVSTVAPGRSPTRTELEDEDRVSITLAAGPTRTLEIVDGDGRPVPGAILVANRTALGRSDEHGRAQVTLSGEGRLEVSAYTDTAFGGAIVERPKASAPDQPARLTVTPNPAVAGLVQHKETGKPIPAALVWASDDPGTFVFADPKGAYRLRPYPIESARQRHVSAAAPGFSSGFAAIPGGDGPVVVLEPTATLEGIVRDGDGTLLRDVELRVLQQGNRYRFDSRQQSARATTDRGGRFRMLDVPMGAPLRLEAWAEGWASAELEIDPLTPEEPRRRVEVTLATGIDAFGYVVDENEQPVVGAHVDLTETTDTSGGVEHMFDRYLNHEPRSTATDGEGRFTFDDLGEGAFDLSLQADGYAPARIPAIPIARGEGPTDLGTVLLEPGATMTGVVVDEQDQPIRSASVRAWSNSAGFRSTSRRRDDAGVETDRTGAFTVDSLRPGDLVSLNVAHADYASEMMQGIRVPNEEPVRIVLIRAATLRGRVVDGNDEGVAAELVLNRQSDGGEEELARHIRGRQHASSDADGAFEIRSLAAGTWDVRASAESFQDAEVHGVVLERGAAHDDLRIEMKPGAVVTGRVLDSRGEPLAGASVEQVAIESGVFARMRRNTKTTTTDGEGHYRLAGLPTGSLSIAADHQEHRKQVRDIDLKLGESSLDFQLERGLEISGQVVDANGEPVAGATMGISSESRGRRISFDHRNEPVHSQSDGSFVLAGLQDGRFRVTAAKQGLAQARSDVVTLAGTSQGGILLQMSTGGAIVGTVTGLSFDDMTQLHLFASHQEQGTSSMAEVSYEGRFRMENLPAGDWSIIAMSPTGSRVQKRVTLPEGAEEVEVELHFGDGLTLAGQVVQGEDPVIGIYVYVQGAGIAQGGTSITDQSGSFVIEGLEAGRYDLTVMSNTRGNRHQETIELDSDDQIVIRLPAPGRVAGRAVDASTGTPIDGATVEIERLRSDEEESFRGFPFGAPLRTGAAGTFELRSLGAGRYRLRIRQEGYAVATTDVEVTAGSTRDVGEIALEPSAGLTVDVRLPTGTPPIEASVALLDAADQLVLREQRPLNEQGRLHVAQAPAGTWTLLVSAPGQATIRQPITIPTAPVSVVLPPVGQLEIEVAALRGAGTRAELRIRDAAGRPYFYLTHGLVIDRFWVLDGVARVDALPAGVWQLEITSRNDGGSWAAQATVLAGSQQKVVVP